ncbi:MAG: hypothetical protein ABSH35_19005 [Isosphaeraceae bacterium]|jgi:hypothetical protein
MPWTLRRLLCPAVVAAGLAGLLVGGLLVGCEPVGGDPDRLYRPLKEEFARFLSRGQLPFWSDRFGLGIPLLAESHVAAFYPPNWLIYSIAGISTAYRLAMWLHYVLLAAATYAYARFLRISPHGAAIAALAFTCCGFQAIHSTHEPFYHALPYMTLAVLLAEWHLRTGRWLHIILLAVTWGAQLTLGHFQLQMWTAALVLLLGAWRAAYDGLPWRRVLGLILALGWGAALAGVQLLASWELARFVGFTHRSFAELAFFAFPPAHWAELAIPGFLRGIPGGAEAPYWYEQGTSGYEACFYIGTLPLLLAFLAPGGGRRDGRLAPWLFIIAASVSLAMLPRAWPAAYAVVLEVPGFGWFRAPGRYVVLSSLGLCLAAGAGFDRAAGPASIRRGVATAWAFAIAAAGWAIYWALRPDHRAVLGGSRFALVMGSAALSWVVATALLLAWCRRRALAWVLVLATAAELGWLYYTSTTVWGWAVDLPSQSPVLARLAAEPDMGRVAGLVHDLPIRAGAAPIFPYTGLASPPPHPDLELATRREEAFSAAGLARLRRYGVTHGIWDGPVDHAKATTLLECDDPVLDRLVYKPPGAPARARWRLVRYPEPFPPARAAIRFRVATHERALLSGVSFDPDIQAVWYRAGDQPPASAGPIATTAKVISWDGRTALVEHDGTCDLVINRTYYPGWFASVNEGLEQPVARAEIGVQAVRLLGHGPSRVTFVYRPSGLGAACAISLGASGLACLSLIVEAVRAVSRRIGH